jgi:phage protein D
VTSSTTLVRVATVKVGGSAIPQPAVDALRSLRVEMSLWTPSRCTIRFADPDFALVDGTTFEVGKELNVSVPSSKSNTATEVFKGEITDMAVEPGTAGHELVIGGLDKSHRLAVATTVKSYTNQTWTQIVEAIAGNAGLGKDVSIANTAQQPYVLQTVSDYAFLWDIAMRTGCEWWVDGGKLSFKKRVATDGPAIEYGKDLVDFRVRYSGATHPNKVTVNGWNRDEGTAITSDDSGLLTSTSVPGVGGSSTFVTGNRGKANTAWGKAVVIGGYGVKDVTEAKAIADAVAARVDAAEVVARGVAHILPTIKVGELLEVKNLGTKISGKYLVTSVEHLVGVNRVETRFTAGNKAPVGLADLVGQGTGATPGWGHLGVVVGTVTDNTADPDKAGRIKVKFPTLSQQDTSEWARLAGPGAGNGVGLHWTPEVNDEVLVAFEHGDLRHPVIVGGLWSKKNKPPVTTGADPVVSRMFKSKLGHTIEVSDGSSPDKKHIALALAGSESKLRMGADKTELTVASGKELTIKAGNAVIKVDSGGAVTIEGGNVTIEAKTGDLTLKGMNVNLKGTMGVNIEAGTQLKLKGSAAGELDGGGMTTIKGGMVKIN